MSIGAITNETVQQVNFNGGTDNVNQIDIIKNGVRTTVWTKKRAAKFKVKLQFVPNYFGGRTFFNMFRGSGTIDSQGQSTGWTNLTAVIIHDPGTGYVVDEFIDAINPCTTMMNGKNYNIYPISLSTRGSTIRAKVASVDSSGGITALSLDSHGLSEQRVAAYKFGDISDNNYALEGVNGENPYEPDAIWTVSAPGEGPANKTADPDDNGCNSGQFPAERPAPEDDEEGDTGQSDQTNQGDYDIDT